MLAEEFKPTFIGFSLILYFTSMVILGSVYLMTEPLDLQIKNPFSNEVIASIGSSECFSIGLYLSLS